MKIKEMAEKIRKEMPDGLDELEQLRFIYIFLGKSKRFDPKYYFGNSQTRRKIYMLANKNLQNEEFLTEKKDLICISIASVLKLVANEFGIDVSLEKDETGIGAHMYNSVKLKSGLMLQLDLQQDLKFIHTWQRTENFGQTIDNYFKLYGQITDTELEYIDEKIGYKKRNEPYRGEYISSLLSEAKSKSNIDSLKTVLEDAKFNDTIQNVDGYLEGITYMKNLFKQMELKNIAYVINCYRDENVNKEPLPERQYSILVYGKDKNNPIMYMFKKKIGKFVPVSIRQVQNLIKQGLKMNNDSSTHELMSFINSQEKEL